MRRHAVVFIVSVGLLFGTKIWAAGEVALKLAEAPCIQGASDAEILKAKLSGTHAGERACKEVLKEAKQKVEQRVHDQAEAYYNGCDLDPIQAANVKAGACGGNPVPRETCNTLETPGVAVTFNKGVENTSNHVGRGCGEWPFFNARLSGTTCSITPDYTRTNQYIEDSFNRGAWIQALNCYHAQVQAEIAVGKIRLTTVKDGQGNEVPGPCSTMASEYFSLKNTSDQMSKAMEKKFAGQSNIVDIEHCAADDAAVAADSSKYSDTDPDAGKHRQSACQLRTSRRALEAMYMQLASCEVWTRAGRSYDAFLGQSPGRDLVKEQARAAINGIHSREASMCSHDTILNQYYIPRYMSAFKAKASQIWNAQACAPVTN